MRAKKIKNEILNGWLLTPKFGCVSHYIKNLVTNDKGPSIIWCYDGSREWYKDEFLHRMKGPAVIYENMVHYWYQNGNLHREDGAAAIWLDPKINPPEWWIKGKKIK